MHIGSSRNLLDNHVSPDDGIWQQQGVHVGEHLHDSIGVGGILRYGM